jgi:hypothetical protein
LTKTVKHASAVRFDEYNTKLTESDELSPGALILSGINPSLPDISSCVDISDHPHLGTPPFMISLALPPQGSGLGCLLCTDTYHNLPYIASFASGTPLSQHLLLHGQHNSSFWILSLDSKEFITAASVISYLKSLQQPSTTMDISANFARRIASHRTSLARNRAIFNQIKLISSPSQIPDTPTHSSIIAPVGLKVVSSFWCYF